MKVDALRHEYEQPCSRCGGSGVDPDSEDCACDCCEEGTEKLYLTADEAFGYPNATRKEPKV